MHEQAARHSADSACTLTEKRAVSVPLPARNGRIAVTTQQHSQQRLMEGLCEHQIVKYCGEVCEMLVASPPWSTFSLGISSCNCRILNFSKRSFRRPFHKAIFFRRLFLNLPPRHNEERNFDYWSTTPFFSGQRELGGGDAEHIQNCPAVYIQQLVM